MRTQIATQLDADLQTALEPWRVISRDPIGVDVDQLEARLLAGEAALADALVLALWGTGRPSTLWWRSPLGAVVGMALTDDVGLTQLEAAEVLEVTRSTVATLLTRGGSDLEEVSNQQPGPGRPSETRVSLRSVLRRRARRRAGNDNTDSKDRQ